MNNNGKHGSPLGNYGSTNEDEDLSSDMERVQKFAQSIRNAREGDDNVQMHVMPERVIAEIRALIGSADGQLRALLSQQANYQNQLNALPNEINSNKEKIEEKIREINGIEEKLSQRLREKKEIMQKKEESEKQLKRISGEIDQGMLYRIVDLDPTPEGRRKVNQLRDDEGRASNEFEVCKFRLTEIDGKISVLEREIQRLKNAIASDQEIIRNRESVLSQTRKNLPECIKDIEEKDKQKKQYEKNLRNLLERITRS